MKNKPTRHKEENRFKFKPFSERVDEIKIDAFHKVVHRNERYSEEVLETYFYQCLQKWNFINLSETYCNFRKEVKDIITLPQLLNKKEDVIETLRKYLRLQNPLSLPAILELLVAVSKDLQKEFCLYFPSLLTDIIALLHTKDAEQLENTFSALAYLFKSLWRYLVKNVENISSIFNLLVPLLDDSYPEYINNFAAESFAFVVRKFVKLKKEDGVSFLQLIINSVESKEKRIPGIGKLLFSVILGVSREFHSCTKTLLSLYIEMIRDESLNQIIVYQVLLEIFNCIAQHIKPGKMGMFWEIVIERIDNFSITTEESSNEREHCLIVLLRLIKSIIEHKGGRMLQDPKLWMRKLTALIDKHRNNTCILKEIVITSVETLLAENIQSDQEITSYLVIKLLGIKNKELLLSITEKTVSHSSFESLILPRMLKNGIFSDFDSDLLTVLVRIIQVKAPPSLNGIEAKKWQKYPLNINTNSIMEFMKNDLPLSRENGLTEQLLKTLIIVPHLSELTESLIEKVEDTLKYIYEFLMDNSEELQGEQRLSYCFGFLIAVQCLVHILDPKDFHELIDHLAENIVDPLKLLELYKEDISILSAFDMGLTKLKESVFGKLHINENNFDSLYNEISVKLLSPCAQIRLIAAHIISLFSNVESLYIEYDDASGQSALELPYLAENEPATIQHYRDRLLHIKALNFQESSTLQLKSKYQVIPLRYLFGNLHVNFSLLWEPILEVISSFANNKCGLFWSTFITELQSNQDFINEIPKYNCNILCTITSKLHFSDTKCDSENYKLLLWKCMKQFVHYCEPKNRDFVNMFISFVEDHFFKSNSDVAKSYNIKRLEGNVNNSMNDETMEDEDFSEIPNIVDQEINSITENNESLSKLNQEENSKENELDIGISKRDDPTPGFEENFEHKSDDEGEGKLKNKYDKGRKNKIKLLIAMLELFGKFTNVRSLYREPEIQKIYLDLLSSKNKEVQKAALNFIYAYKYDYIMPYKEHLNNLLEEKNFKNELIRFQINEDNNVIDKNHRNKFLPILMRILHSKMVMRVGMRTGGKAGGLIRRKCILRFLAGVEEDEIMIFIHMAFKPFQLFLQQLSSGQNLLEMTDDIIKNTNLESVIPPKRLQSTVNLLSIIIEQFGGKMMTKLLPQMLGLLICIQSQIVGILNRSHEVIPGCLPIYRNIRKNSVNILVRFFGHFENYAWTTSEIDAVFNVYVFPQLHKLPNDGIHSPTPLLKLFTAWSVNPRYFPLFMKFESNDSSVSPLPFIIELLLNPKAHKSVISAILDIIEKLLTLQDFEKDGYEQMDVDEKPASLLSVVSPKLAINEKYVNEINYGSAILLRHVTEILEYVKRRLSKAKSSATKCELIILSRISEFVKDSAVCDTLLTLIIPILSKKVAHSEETLMQLLTTVINLMQHVERPEIHLRSIQNLLGSISSIPARKLLIQLLKEMAKNSKSGNHEKQILYYDVIGDLNAWDSRWIDQPDFQKRLDAFTQIQVFIDKNDVSLEFGVAVIYTCFFYLRTENDLALRDRSGQCLKSIGSYLAKNYKDNTVDRNYLIDNTILTMVRQGIRSSNDNFKILSIAFLGHMAMNCPDVHPVLRDLHLLTSKQDLEVDFFENIQHLQLHRRVRAFNKFCSIAKTLEKPPNTKTLTQFILPLVSSYLCNQKFMGKNSIVDICIDTLATVCKLLPWNQYEIVLRHYLDKLRASIEFQRQLIRIVVAILDSFHFDLSKLKDTESEFQKVKKDITVYEEVKESLVDDFKDNDILEGNEITIEEISNETIESEEKLDEVLDNKEMEAMLSDEIHEVETAEKKPAVEKHVVLSPSMAKRLVQSIAKGLLPQLHRAISVRTKFETNHKVNKKKYNTDQEEEELMRVPIALALVKLLQKMPNNMLQSNLRPIFTKICTFLKSRLDSVRRITREILQKIMITLGPDYLHHLLREMNSLLTKGYQVHVLSFTMHAVLNSLKSLLQPSHMKSNLQCILSVCKMDLFGPSAEEKEIAEIVRNVSEAKSSKCYDIYHILGETIDESSIVFIIMPLKDILIKTHSHKTIRKTYECLKNLGLGLVDNKFIEIEAVITFLYDVSAENIPQLFPDNRIEEPKETKFDTLLSERKDIFIIPAEPKNKMGIKNLAKMSKNANVHVMVEFGLRTFHILLKRDKVSDTALKSRLNSFMLLLVKCLRSQFVKIVTLSLQCINWLMKLELKNMNTQVDEICDNIFKILHKFAVAGLSKGDNYDLVMAAFKTMAVLIRDVKQFKISADQLKILLVYAEQDLYDSEKQATAFGLLKAVIHRKLMSPELNEVMEKVAKLSVTSELENIRKQARVVFYNYLFNYPMEKHVEKHVMFYCNQLSYELLPGRLSALEMIFSIITSFPTDVLTQHSELMFFMIGIRLVNDDDPECKKGCAKCIKEIVERVSHNQRSKLFDLVVLWLKDRKLLHRRLASQLCGIFVSVEKDNFTSRLSDILPLLVKQFYPEHDENRDNEPGRFVKIRKEEDTNIIDKHIKDPERLKDHHLFQVLQLLLKICANCVTFLKDNKYQDQVNSFAQYSQTLLGHPHLWVRLAATQFLGFVLAALDSNKLKILFDDPEEFNTGDGFIYSDPVNTTKSLILDLVVQLHPDIESDDLFDQIVKNLVFIARHLKVQPIKTGKTKEEVKIDLENEVTLFWMTKKLRKCINIEITHASKSTSVRNSVFKWIAGVMSTVPIDSLRPILFHFISPLSREMITTEESNAPLRQLAKEVAKMIKGKIGPDEYTNLLNQAQMKLEARRALRKRDHAQQFVTDPEAAAKKKVARQQKKKEAKKRKMEVMKGKRFSRKRPRTEVNLEA